MVMHGLANFKFTEKLMYLLFV